MEEGNILDWLPDIVMLRVVQYLEFSDRLTLSEIRPRLRDLSYDRSVVRVSNLEGSYRLTDDNFKDYVNNACQFITVLNLNHCYWLSQRCLLQAIRKCCHLEELHVIQCSLKIDSMVGVVADLGRLRSLSFSIGAIDCLSKQHFVGASKVLRNLRSLCVYFSCRELSRMHYHGARSTLLDFCENLERLSIGSAEISIPQYYLPVLTEPSKLGSLRSMSLSSNIHGGALMLFYATLLELAKLEIRFETLLMPNVNFEEFSSRPELANYLKNAKQLRNLDISGCRQDLEGNHLDISEARQLVYFNIARTKATSRYLSTVASGCPYLVSFNVFGCDRIFRGQDNSSHARSDGLIDVLERCTELRHLNIGGIHYEVIRNVMELTGKIKGLRSLAISVCLLCHNYRSYSETTSSERRAKRHCPDDLRKRRTEHTASYADASSGSVLDQIVENNPDLRSLEIVSAGFVSAFQQNEFIKSTSQRERENAGVSYISCDATKMVQDAALLPIAKLKYLTQLTIIAVPGLRGTSLSEIARCCEKLERLSLGYIGLALSEHNAFSKALPMLQKLKDLRLEQVSISLGWLFFSSLSRCKQLQRLCVVARCSCVDPNHVMQCVEQLPNLIVVQLFVDETLIGCHKLLTALKKRFSKSRPGFSVCVSTFTDPDIKDMPSHIPAKHYGELTRFTSNVCSLPPAGVS